MRDTRRGTFFSFFSFSKCKHTTNKTQQIGIWKTQTHTESSKVTKRDFFSAVCFSFVIVSWLDCRLLLKSSSSITTQTFRQYFFCKWNLIAVSSEPINFFSYFFNICERIQKAKGNMLISAYTRLCIFFVDENTFDCAFVCFNLLHIQHSHTVWHVKRTIQRVIDIHAGCWMKWAKRTSKSIALKLMRQTNALNLIVAVDTAALTLSLFFFAFVCIPRVFTPNSHLDRSTDPSTIEASPIL